MYNPLNVSNRIEKHVIENNLFKKYYRFRGAKFYGGISTADVVGCNLFCYFCWVHSKVRFQVQNVGKFYSPEEVAQRLIQIAQKARFTHLRVSGGEPTIGSDHLVALLESLTKFDFIFILETNGMLLSQESYVNKLKEFPNLHVRISLKAGTPEMFSRVTGAVPDAYFYPLNALKLLLKYKIPCHPSVIIDFCPKPDFQFLIQELQKIDTRLVTQLELESLLLYPHVIKGLKKIGFSIDLKNQME
jgi:uncharacterized Fe-S cluster-containing radical SAM superfamily protein